MAKAKTSKKKITKKKASPKVVEAVFTLSKYDFGEHHFYPVGRGEPSFAESTAPIKDMIATLYRRHGVSLGTKIRVTMKPIKSEKSSVKKA